MPKVSALARSTRARVAVAVLLVVGGVALWAGQASASAALTVTPITFNVVGLDSNNVNAGPNEFPVGERICNTGDATATNVGASFAWNTTNALVNLTGPTTEALGSLAANACTDAYFTVVVTRDVSAYDTTRQFTITATADGGVSTDSPSVREIYVEHLVSQNRNSIASITGPSTVYVGSSVQFTLDGSTATQGYEQLESFLSLNAGIFRVRSVTGTYTSPTGGTNDKVWADACGFDFDPANIATYLSCVGPEKYTGGKAGGTVNMTYTVDVIGTGSATLTAMIYDFSGSSFHYNSDYGTVTKAVVAAPAADLSVTSAHTDPFTRGTNDSYTWTVANAGPSNVAGPITVASTLPASLSFISGSGTGATCAAVAQVVTCTLANTLNSGDSVPLTINVAVSASAAASFTPSITVSSATHDTNAANDTTTDPTNTIAAPTTTTTAGPTTTTTVAPTTTTTAAPTTTTTIVLLPTTTTTAAPTTTTTVAPTTTTTIVLLPTTTTTTVHPTTTTTVHPTTTTTSVHVTTTTSTTVHPTTTTTTIVHLPTTTTTTAPPNDAVSFVVDNGEGVSPIIQPTDVGATYTFITGVLPPGVTLTADGQFSGKATQNGTYEFDASVCQHSGACTVRHVTVKVLGVTAAIPFAQTGGNTLALFALALLLLAAGGVARYSVTSSGRASL